VWATRRYLHSKYHDGWTPPRARDAGSDEQVVAGAMRCVTPRHCKVPTGTLASQWESAPPAQVGTAQHAQSRPAAQQPHRRGTNPASAAVERPAWAVSASSLVRALKEALRASSAFLTGAPRLGASNQPPPSIRPAGKTPVMKSRNARPLAAALPAAALANRPPPVRGAALRRTLRSRGWRGRRPCSPR
jgi:hypothetical protein